jgi:hypothetical protein
VLDCNHDPPRSDHNDEESHDLEPDFDHVSIRLAYEQLGAVLQLSSFISTKTPPGVVDRTGLCNSAGHTLLRPHCRPAKPPPALTQTRSRRWQIEKVAARLPTTLLLS